MTWLYIAFDFSWKGKNWGPLACFVIIYCASEELKVHHRSSSNCGAIRRQPTISNWNCHYVKWSDYRSIYVRSINHPTSDHHFTQKRTLWWNLHKLRGFIYDRDKHKTQSIKKNKYSPTNLNLLSLWCCDSSWKGLLWELVLTMTLNTWADGNKKCLLLGLSFANFENDLVRWDVHIKWPLTRSYLLRQAPNMGPHLNQFLSDRIFLWYSMGGTNADTMVKGWGAHLLKSKCISILLRAAIHSISQWYLNHFLELFND